MDDFKRHGSEVLCKHGPKCTGICGNDKKLARRRGRRKLKVRLRKELDNG